jgi:SAM-dependent methyltransferase
MNQNKRMVFSERSIRLNIGCGNDYREGFINIDGRADLPKIDQVINLSIESLLKYFKEGTVDFILANDFVEHHFHWEAVRIMKDFYALLKPAGVLEMRLPDFEGICSSPELSMTKKITLLFGGQDISQGEEDPSSREKSPQFFCHKYAFTQETMKQELDAIGFKNIITRQEGTNFVVTAVKPSSSA